MTAPVISALGWRESDCHSADGSKPPVTGQQVFDEFLRLSPAQPTLITSTNTDPKKNNWKWNFTLVYPVTLNGWRFTVLAHVHVQNNNTNLPGKAFIPALSGKSFDTPQFVADAAPTYDASVHVDGWNSDDAAATDYYTNNNRHPHKL